MPSVCRLAVLVVLVGFAAQAAKGRPGRRAKPAASAKKKALDAKARSAPEVSPDATEPAPTASPPGTATAAQSRGPTRIDFDDRLIQGQTNKSGAVYLYDRKELKTRSMIKKRESFREEIIGSVYDS